MSLRSSRCLLLRHFQPAQCIYRSAPSESLSFLSRRSRSRPLSTSIIRREAAAFIPPRQPLAVRFVKGVGIVILCSALGFAMAAIPAIQAAQAIMNPPSDAETLAMYTPPDEASQEAEDHITKCWLARELREKPGFSEARPHLKIPESQRSHNLTGGTLMGRGKVLVPPLTFTERGGKSLVSISYLGSDLCGHPGIIHGGFLATMLDEGLARCCFGALPNKIGMTANLNINYKSPAPADAYVVLRATTTKVEGRKAWVEGRIETLVEEGETPRVLAEATALFIEPRQAATMARVYPTD